MKVIKISFFVVLSLMVSCGKKNDDGVSTANLSSQNGTSLNDGFLPSDIKSITIQAYQENGEGFAISTDQEKNIGEPTLEDGRIYFDVSYETFSGSNENYTQNTSIFSLVNNGFVQQNYPQQEFSQMMSPGIYILTVDIKKQAALVARFKAKMVVRCAQSLQKNSFTVDPSKVTITPLYQVNFNGRNINLGFYSHNLSQVVTSYPSGANLGRYSYDLDSNGDGSLRIINGVKVNEVAYGLDIINRSLFSPTVAYSTFADDQRTVVYKIYDECYNSKSIEVSTGSGGVFSPTEKEDVFSPDVMPSLTVNPSYMVATKRPFLQQAQVQTVPSANCGQKVGGVNYPAGCDPRLTGIMSLIGGSRAGVLCSITNGTLNINASETLPTQVEGYNFNLIDKYSANLTISGLNKVIENGYPLWKAVNAKISKYTLTVPGAGDQIGKQTFSTSNCSLAITLPEALKSFTPCGENQTGNGTYNTTQHARVAYKCTNVPGNLGSSIKLAGELYCIDGVKSTKTDCVNPVNPPPPPGNTPVPPVNPPVPNPE